VTNGKTRYGSGAVRSTNQNAPPMSRPVTIGLQRPEILMRNLLAVTPGPNP
jgi:hypothetical protein